MRIRIDDAAELWSCIRLVASATPRRYGYANEVGLETIDDDLYAIRMSGEAYAHSKILCQVEEPGSAVVGNLLPMEFCTGPVLLQSKGNNLKILEEDSSSETNLRLSEGRDYLYKYEPAPDPQNTIPKAVGAIKWAAEDPNNVAKHITISGNKMGCTDKIVFSYYAHPDPIVEKAVAIPLESFVIKGDFSISLADDKNLWIIGDGLCIRTTIVEAANYLDIGVKISEEAETSGYCVFRKDVLLHNMRRLEVISSTKDFQGGRAILKLENEELTAESVITESGHALVAIDTVEFNGEFNVTIDPRQIIRSAMSINEDEIDIYVSDTNMVIVSKGSITNLLSPISDDWRKRKE